VRFFGYFGFFDPQRLSVPGREVLQRIPRIQNGSSPLGAPKWLRW
jgi:hypothetical protein